MEFKEVVGRRRSIRYFLPFRPVEKEKIQTILEAARLASCAVNASFLRAIVVERDKTSREVLESLKVPTTTLQLDLAPVHIYFYGNLKAIDESHGKTLKELYDVGALNPTHGWSYKFIDEVVWPQILEPAGSALARRSRAYTSKGNTAYRCNVTRRSWRNSSRRR